MERTRGKMLVIRGGAIGDFILTLPVLSALREAFPDTHLEVLGYPRLAELATSAGIIDGFRSIEARALAGFFARKGTLDPELTKYFESFSVIFSYLYDPDEIFRTNIARCSKAQYYQGPHRPNETESTHATAVFLKPLESLAIFEADPVPRLSLQRGVLRGDEALPGKWLALHPGSGSEKKNWPEEGWAELIGRVIGETAWNLLLVGGEAEGERLERLRRGIPPERVMALQNLPLVQLAERLAKASVFVGHDSGISHLAAAVGVPGLVLWGPSRQEIWRPLHPEARILAAGERLAGLPVNEVFEALKPLLQAGAAYFAE